MKTGGRRSIGALADWTIVALSALALVSGACAGAPGPRPTTFIARSPTTTAGASASPGVPSRSVAGSRSPEPALSMTLVPFAGGLEDPLFVTHAGDGSGVLYAVEQGGRIRVLDADGTLRPTPFLDISARIRAGGEQGLLGLAFHPQFPDDPRFFVMYTAAGDGTNTVSEFSVSDGEADAASERILIAIPDFAGNHNGGNLVFAPDGQLYIGTGDGGGAGDPEENGQDPDSLLGKILRMDVDAARPEPAIWALGMRNPWRFSFDRQTGDLWIADVGQGDWEEIDVERAGSGGGNNYGWNVMEGPDCFVGLGCDESGLTLPVVAYTHDQGCTVVGGYVYRGVAHPELDGTYFYGDYCSGRFWGLDGAAALSGEAEATVVLESGVTISSFGEDEQGELYVTDLTDGTIMRLVPVP